MTFLSFLTSSAYANVPLSWGFESTLAGWRVARYTYFASAVIIVLIEAYILHRFFKTGIKSILISFGMNLFSVICGVFFAMSFAVSCGIVVPFLIVTLPFCFSYKFNLSFGYTFLIWLMFLAGGYFTGMMTFDYYKLSPARLLLCVELSLLMGFSLSVILETVFIRLFKYLPENTLKAVFYANVFSYIFLMMLYPFFAPSPYKGPVFEDKTRFREIQFAFFNNDSDTVISALDKENHSLQYFLGLRKNEEPLLKNYNAENEIRAFSKTGFIGYDGIAVKAIDFFLNEFDLTTDASDTLSDMKSYFTFYNTAFDAIETDDQQKLDKIYSDWMAWGKSRWGKSKYSERRISGLISDKSPPWSANPDDMIERILNNLHSDLMNPSLPESDT